jgi:hypothetical protein
MELEYGRNFGSITIGLTVPSHLAASNNNAPRGSTRSQWIARYPRRIAGQCRK